jgi:hypothetical protein
MEPKKDYFTIKDASCEVCGKKIGKHRMTIVNRIMKILFLIPIICMTGCAFYRHTIVTAKGDKLSVPIAGILSARGDKVDIKLDRILCIGKCEVNQ